MTTTSMISAVRTYLATYSGLATNAPLWVNYLGADPTQYAIIPLAGTKIIEQYLDGGSLREFPFAFQSMESTADELERLESIGFYEAFSAWLESQTAAGTFPTLNAGQTPETIEALTWGFLYQQGESATGIYQVTCKLTYSQL
jgi:hypothetical protein